MIKNKKAFGLPEVLITISISLLVTLGAVGTVKVTNGIETSSELSVMGERLNGLRNYVLLGRNWGYSTIETLDFTFKKDEQVLIQMCTENHNTCYDLDVPYNHLFVNKIDIILNDDSVTTVNEVEIDYSINKTGEIYGQTKFYDDSGTEIVNVKLARNEIRYKDTNSIGFIEFNSNSVIKRYMKDYFN